MKNFLWVFLFVPLFNYSQINDKVKLDSSIVFGKQEWIVKNLNISVFRNGDTIQEAKTDEEWQKAGVEKRAVWCYFDNDSTNGIKYGRLYNWYAVNDPRGLAPDGWHIPRKDEWDELIEHFGGGNKRQYIEGTNNLKSQPPWGKYMKSEQGWIREGNGNNQTGFSALPGGSGASNGSFKHTQQFYFGPLGQVGAWWAADTDYDEMAWFVRIKYNEDKTFSADQAMTFGLSVRVVKVELINPLSNIEKKFHISKAESTLDTISNDQIIKDSLVRIKGSELPFTGVVKGVTRYGISWYQNYVDGLKNGYYSSWHNPNRIESLVIYLNGKMEGTTGKWRIDGSALREKNYVNGILDGKWNQWYKNGKKRIERNYLNGKLISSKEWDENGIEKK